MNARNKGLRARCDVRMNIAIGDVLRDQEIFPVARNSDSLDFHDIGIDRLRAMLEAAYLKGRAE